MRRLVGLCLVPFAMVVLASTAAWAANSFAQIVTITRALAHPMTGVDWSIAARLAAFAAPLLLAQAVQYGTGKLFFLDFRWARPEVRTAIYAALSYCILFLGGTPQAFIYFQF